MFAGEVSGRDDAIALARRLRARADSLPRADGGAATASSAGSSPATSPAQIVDSDEHTVAFMDINPATPGHALVVPRAHSADLIEISDDDLERDDARRPAPRRSGWSETLEPDGFNLINSCGAAAWQTVFHFHLHVVPATRTIR